MKLRLLTLAIFCSILIPGYAQTDSLAYKQRIAINLNDLLIRRVFLSYSYALNPDHYLDVNLGYRFSYKKTGDNFLGFGISDAWWYYNTATFRIGVKKYFNHKKFIALYISYNYRYFNKLWFNSYVDHEGDAYDEDYVISRTKNQIGYMLKFGAESFKGKGLSFEPYFGFGTQYSIVNESIEARYDWQRNLIPDNYPVKTSKAKPIFTFHAGISVGFRK